MSTDVGLDKYDSYQVKKYRNDEKQPGTISSNNIRCIYEDRSHNLWFGTVNGLNLYNADKDNFKVFINDSTDKNSINNNCINSIIEDKKGTLWIVSGGNCLNKWVPKTQNFVRYQLEGKKYNVFVRRPARMIACDSKGCLWVVTLNSGVHRFDPESGKFTDYDDLSMDMGENCYKSIYVDSQDKVWITTDGYGFFSFDPVTNKFEQFDSKVDGKGTNQKIILDIIPEDENHLLLAVDQGGINRFNKVSKTFNYIKYDKTDEGLNNDGIWCFHKDKDGILWVGTSGGGINYYDPKKGKFKLFRHNNDSKSLSFNFTGCFFEDYQGLIWIGTDGGGVNVYDPNTGNFTLYRHNPYDPYSLSGDVIRSIAEDKDHDIWIATWDAGLNRYDRKTGRFFRYLPEKNNPSSISGRTIWNLRIDQNGILWLGVYNVGVDLFDKSKGVIRRFRADPGNPKAISSNDSWFFAKDDENKMWICTENGLNLYDSKTNSFKIYNFPDNSIGAFCKDRDGNLWVGSTTAGLYYCKPNGQIIKTFNITNGLPHNRIHAIIEDNHGNLWISTSGGISRFDRNTRKFRNYSKDDGLQGDQFFQQSFLKTRKGEIYFGGYNGFNSFYPDSLKDNNIIPPVYITDLQIFNKPVLYGGSQFQEHISEAKEITLSWNQSVFSFAFAAINYRHPEKNQYTYIMEGFEKELNYTNASRRYVTYTNLNPGKYTFHVRASNNDGVWNEKGVSLRIIILPPWWKTWWLKIIVIILILTSMFSIYYIRIAYYQEKQKELSILVGKRTSELQQSNDDLEKINNQLIEQKAQITKQAEELHVSSLILTEANTLLQKRQSLIEEQSEELKVTNQQLSVLNATKDRFFSIIAHDLRNPFNVVSGFAEILIKKFDKLSPEKIRKFHEMIHTSSLNGNNLLENLLQWSRSQTGRIAFEPIQLNLLAIAEETMRLVEGDAERKHITIQQLIEPNLTVFADENMIKTIFRNLVSNAVKFTGENGTITLKSKTDGQMVTLSVADTGMGIPAETISKLFRVDTIVTTKGTAKESGTGLGLLLCKEFVEKHKGKIWIESEVGKGSEFKFTLTLA